MNQNFFKRTPRSLCMLYTKCSFFYGCQWPLLGPKNVKLAWKFLMDVIKDEEKICHMDNRSGQWAKFSSPLWKEIPVHHHFLHFEALFPKGRKSITFDIFLTVQNCIPCAVDPTSIWYIFLAYPDFSQGNCTWQYAKLHSECNWLESHYFTEEGGKNVLAILFLCLSGSCYSDGNKQTNKLLSGVSLRIHNWKQM